MSLFCVLHKTINWCENIGDDSFQDQDFRSEFCLYFYNPDSSLALLMSQKSQKSRKTYLSLYFGQYRKLFQFPAKPDVFCNLCETACFFQQQKKLWMGFFRASSLTVHNVRKYWQSECCQTRSAAHLLSVSLFLLHCLVTYYHRVNYETKYFNLGFPFDFINDPLFRITVPLFRFMVLTRRHYSKHYLFVKYIIYTFHI